MPVSSQLHILPCNKEKHVSRSRMGRQQHELIYNRDGHKLGAPTGWAGLGRVGSIGGAENFHFGGCSPRGLGKGSLPMGFRGKALVGSLGMMSTRS